MIDQTVIGSKTETFEFEVEKGAIRAFASAIGDDNPLYFDESYAQALGYASIVAPQHFRLLSGCQNRVWIIWS